jgi:hypothetical protein
MFSSSKEEDVQKDIDDFTLQSKRKDYDKIVPIVNYVINDDKFKNIIGKDLPRLAAKLHIDGIKDVDSTDKYYCLLFLYNLSKYIFKKQLYEYDELKKLFDNEVKSERHEDLTNFVLKYFGDTGIPELIVSFSQNGLAQPIIIVKNIYK